MPPLQHGAVVAVTGATGFIGSHVCSELLSAGFRVRAVVRNPDDEAKVGHLRALPHASEHLTFHRGDLDKAGSYDDAFRGAQAVIHTATVVEINDSKDPEGEIVKPSVEGTKNVPASVDKSGSVQRYVHTSSVIAAMKWDEPLDMTFSEDVWNTVSTVQNGDPYGYAKATAEKIVHEHKNTSYDAITILPGVNLGPCMTKAHTKSSAVVIRQMLFGNRQADYHAHFVDVRDTAQAHVRALTASLQAGSACRVLAVSDAQMRVCDLEKHLPQLFPQYIIEAKPLLFQWLLQVPILCRLAGSDFQRMIATQQFTADNRKSKQMLGLQYKTLEETLRDTVKSMIDTGFVAPRKSGQSPPA